MIELRLEWWRNIETGLVRSFLGGGPKHGKWERVPGPTLRTESVKAAPKLRVVDNVSHPK